MNEIIIPNTCCHNYSEYEMTLLDWEEKPSEKKPIVDIGAGFSTLILDPKFADRVINIDPVYGIDSVETVTNRVVADVTAALHDKSFASLKTETMVTRVTRILEHKGKYPDQFVTGCAPEALYGYPNDSFYLAISLDCVLKDPEKVETSLLILQEMLRIAPEARIAFSDRRGVLEGIIPLIQEQMPSINCTVKEVGPHGERLTLKREE
ncbi:hypothetical protein K9M41_03795 [Candidatus Gracilibacteria bacterium]|nr:hypothetical protein [Candidatus Gracilibacteria bacterium]